MMEPISIALALAKFVPDVIGLFSKKNGRKADEAMSTVTEIAEELTGASGKDAIEALDNNPNLQLEFKKAVMAHAQIKEQLAYEDRKNARAMYSHHNEKTDEISSWIMLFNLPVIIILVVIQIACMYLLKENAQLLALIANVVGYVTSALLNERQQVTNFRFGSSVGSKLKDHKET